jgi:Protein of unknown function (DUF1236)
MPYLPVFAKIRPCLWHEIRLHGCPITYVGHRTYDSISPQLKRIIIIDWTFSRHARRLRQLTTIAASFFSSGNACFNAFVTNSVTMSPMLTAWWEAAVTGSDSTFNDGVKNYRYTVVNNRTVLVDPRSHRIVQVIE